MHHDIRTAVENDWPRIREELDALIRVPSISAPSFDASKVRDSAELVADLLRSSGLDNVQLLELPDAHPAVFGELKGPEDAPTVLLYAHHDVQPPGPARQWETEPFEPTEIDGRLFGRGTADDACGIVLHLAMLRALGDKLPVNVKVFMEGEEEIGSRHLVDFLDTYADLLSTDAIIIGDAGNWAPGIPGLTTSLRGLVDLTVTVRTLRFAIHSGSFGGVYPDAITALARTLAKLHNDDGSVAVEGLVSSPATGPEMTEQELAEAALPLSGTELIGTGEINGRLWHQPAISVLAIDAVPVAEAINQLVPEATAKVSMRLAPGQDPRAAMDALKAHIEASAPWGSEVEIDEGALAEAFHLDSSGALYDAYRSGMADGYGRDAVEFGMGGSIPFVAAFAERYPDAEVLLIGVSDPTSRYHGPNESLELEDLKSAIVAQAVALIEYGS